jgi:phage regulator Rha-like protein
MNVAQNAAVNKTTITSLELLEQINVFRRDIENRSPLRHDTLLNIIRDEFEEEISSQNILELEYSTERGRKFPMFELTHAQAKQVLVRESKAVRKATIKYIEELEFKLVVATDSYMIEDPEARAERWLQEYRERKQLAIEVQEKQETIDYILDDTLTFEDFNKELSSIAYMIASQTNTKISDIYKRFYSHLNKKERISVAVRQAHAFRRLNTERIAKTGKEYKQSTLSQKASKLSMIRPDEFGTVIKTMRAYAIDNGVSPHKVDDATRLTLPDVA